MLICYDQRNGSGCNALNADNAPKCQQCGRNLQFALHLHDPHSVIGHYQIIQVIGRGGFGAVYEAKDTRSGAIIALKESFDAESVRGFQREFDILSRLQHPNLTRYYEMFEAEGNGYLIMEFIAGQSLWEIFQRQRVPLIESQVLGYAMQLCDVLSYLHTQPKPIIHRDIKPANVRLTPEGLVKLVDFGLVKRGVGHTATSMPGLSPNYAPIEQWGNLHGHTDARSDIYSLGATLYHLLSGQPPLPATGRLALQQDPLMSPQQHNPALSPHISAAVMQALQLRIEARYDTVLQFRQGLLGARTADGVNLADRAGSFTSQSTVLGGGRSGSQPSSSFADKSTVFGDSQPVSQVVGKRQHDTKPMKRVVSQSPSQSRMMNNAEMDALAVLSNQSVASPIQNIFWGWAGLVGTLGMGGLLLVIMVLMSSQWETGTVEVGLVATPIVRQTSWLVPPTAGQAQGIAPTNAPKPPTDTPVPSTNTPRPPTNTPKLAPADIANSAVCNTVTKIPQAECMELVNLYNNTNGESWQNKTRWLTANTPCNWFGVTCSGGHVDKIDLTHNQLSGTISDFSNLPNLNTLFLSGNQLSGSIPDFTNLPNLQYLDISVNQLTGAIPNFSNLPKLELLALQNNQLSGSIPDFTNLPNLQVLQIHSNQLSGAIPNFSNSSNLTHLWLSGNHLSGPVTNLNWSSFGAVQLNQNCGLVAIDDAQAAVLTSKDPKWQVRKPSCP